MQQPAVGAASLQAVTAVGFPNIGEAAAGGEGGAGGEEKKGLEEVRGSRPGVQVKCL